MAGKDNRVSVVVKVGTDSVEVELLPREFKSGNKGFYADQRVQVGNQIYKAQLILISR